MNELILRSQFYEVNFISFQYYAIVDISFKVENMKMVNDHYLVH
jgi:hypothetical protein